MIHKSQLALISELDLLQIVQQTAIWHRNIIRSMTHPFNVDFLNHAAISQRRRHPIFFKMLDRSVLDLNHLRPKSMCQDLYPGLLDLLWGVNVQGVKLQDFLGWFKLNWSSNLDVIFNKLNTVNYSMLLDVSGILLIMLYCKCVLFPWANVLFPVTS